MLIPLEMMTAGRFLLPAHGAGIFSPVYIDDLVRGISLAAELDAARGQVITISGGEGVRCDEFFGHHWRMLGRTGMPPCVGTPTALVLAELGRRLARLFGRETELGRGAVDMLSRRAGYSIQKAGRLLGYAPMVNLEEGMQRTADWVRAEGVVAKS